MSTSGNRRPTVTVFSSIPSVADALRSTMRSSHSVGEAAAVSSADGGGGGTIIPSLWLDVIQDPTLEGYGGTVDFQPAQLQTSSKLALSKAEILISEPAVVAALLHHDRSALPNLKWCQSTYAGVDPFFADAATAATSSNDTTSSSSLTSPPPSWILTRFAGCFGPPIAEWCMARIIEHERSFAATALDQTKKEWAGSRPQVTNYRYLSSLTLAVLGCGDIGQCIAKAASQAFGMKVIGYGKTPNRDVADVSGIEEYTVDVKYALQRADYVVSVLPSTSETRGLLSEPVLATAAVEQGGKSPVFLNVGRGDVVNEGTLLTALDRGYLSAAILDVFEVEPLPTDSPLWDHPKVVVSPHVSGLTQAQDVPKVFWDNYERFVHGQPLKYVVDWKKGY